MFPYLFIYQLVKFKDIFKTINNLKAKLTIFVKFKSVFVFQTFTWKGNKIILAILWILKGRVILIPHVILIIK